MSISSAGPPFCSIHLMGRRSAGPALQKFKSSAERVNYNFDSCNRSGFPKPRLNFPEERTFSLQGSIVRPNQESTPSRAPIAQSQVQSVMSISDCVQMITGRQADSGNEAEAIEGGLDTIRAAMLRVQDSVVSVQNQSQTLASRANQTVSAVDGGVQSAEMGQSAIDSLRDSVEEIAIVVAEINSVAEQTRLLSLNATIEAARASQSGNGFGVVARNVKELAVKSGTAASRISKLAQRCVTKVGESSRCTSDIRHQLTEIRDIVRSTDGVISEIHSSVTTSASEAEQLATAFGGRRNSRRLESVSGRFGT